MSGTSPSSSAVIRGARVIATASERNHEFVRELGGEPVDYHGDDVTQRVCDLAATDGVDAALDLFGGEDREVAYAVLRAGRAPRVGGAAAARAARGLRVALHLRAARAATSCPSSRA